MPTSPARWPTKVASLALPTREAQVVAAVWPHGGSTLLFLAKINLTQPARQEFTAVLTQTIERVWSEPAPHEANAGQALERVLLQLNPVLKAHERLLGNPLAPRYHLCLAVLHDQTLALSHVGHVGAMVVTPERLTPILNVARRGLSKPFFQHLVEGIIEPGETILLTTSSLFDFFSAEHLPEVIGGQAPGLALREVENSLTNLEHHPPLGVIALRLMAPTETEPSTQSSIDKLLETQDQTSSLLRPKFWSSLMTRLKPKRREAPNPDIATVQYRPQPGAPMAFEPEVASAPRRASLWQRLSASLGKLSWLMSRHQTKDVATWWLEARLAQWRRLPIFKRVLLVLAAIVLVTFSQSIVNMGHVRLTVQSHAQYDQLVTQITELQGEASSALIYHDESKAEARWAAAAALLAQLPRGGGAQEQQYQTLASSLAQLQDKLQHIITPAALAPWANLPAGNWTGAVWLNKTLYAVSAVGQLASLSTNGKLQTLPVTLPRELGSPTALYTLGNSLLVRGKTALALVDPVTNAVTLSNQAPAMRDAASHNSRLYYLTADRAPTIQSVTYTAQGLSAPVPWLKAPTPNLPGGTALTIDGNVYVSSPEHTIQKFVRGTTRDFNLTPLAPPLAQPSLLRTTANGNYLFVADPAAQRLAIYSKQGKLAAQLKLTNLGSPTALVLEPTNTYFYLLVNTQLYRLKILDYVTP